MRWEVGGRRRGGAAADPTRPSNPTPPPRFPTCGQLGGEQGGGRQRGEQPFPPVRGGGHRVVVPPRRPHRLAERQRGDHQRHRRPGLLDRHPKRGQRGEVGAVVDHVKVGQGRRGGAHQGHQHHDEGRVDRVQQPRGGPAAKGAGHVLGQGGVQVAEDGLDGGGLGRVGWAAGTGEALPRPSGTSPAGRAPHPPRGSMVADPFETPCTTTPSG